MTRGLAIISKAVVYLMGLAVLAICAILLPELAREETVANPASHQLIWPFLLCAWALAVPIFVGLHQTLKLLSYIDGDEAFSNRSVRALQNIKTCAIVFSALIVVGVVAGIALARSVDPGEDVAPFVTIGFIVTLASSVIATFAAVLQRLLQDAIAMKAENDLTV